MNNKTKLFGLFVKLRSEYYIKYLIALNKKFIPCEVLMCFLFF